MGKRDIILGFVLGSLLWIGDAVYNFAHGKVAVGMTEGLLNLFPFLDSAWFWTPLYWIVRLIWIGAFVYVLIYLPFVAFGNWIKKRRSARDNKSRILCPKCGAKVVPYQRFCVICGIYIGNPEIRIDK